MKKQVYEAPEMTVVRFDTADVITTSGICALAAGRTCRSDSTGVTDGGDVSGGIASESGGSGCGNTPTYGCAGGDMWFSGGCSNGDGSTSSGMCDGQTGSNGGVA